MDQLIKVSLRPQGKREPLYTVGGNAGYKAIKDNRKEIPQKFKNRTTAWSIDPCSGFITKGNEISISKRYLYSHVYCSCIHSSQDIETT